MSQYGVQVCIRARPFIRREAGSDCYWELDTHQVKLKKEKSKSYFFDRVFSSDEDTSDVYEEIAEPIVQSAMEGFNGTIFAYGQTASGKTYTMLGSPELPGIIPLAINEIFTVIEKTPEREFLLRMSYLEIYNENLKDLLASETVSLSIREDEFRNAHVSGLVEELVSSPGDVMRFLQKGEKIRHMAATNMNDRSSRSHTIFRMVIESRERVDMNRTREDDTAVKIAQLNFVDLAGSERASQTGAEGQRFKEGCFINKSLMVLGQVINQICKDNELGGGSVFISFRDSKLTRILQPSLGGNALTAIICTVTLAVLDDTESTLRFASSAKQVKNKPIVNEVLSDEALLIRQKREINQLRKKIQELEKENQQNDKTFLQKHEYEEKIQKLTRMLLVSSVTPDHAKKQKMRRETWCPGAMGMAGMRLPFLKRKPSALEDIREFSPINNFMEELDTEEKVRLSQTPLSAEPYLSDSLIGSRKRARMEDTKFIENELDTVKEELKATQQQLQLEKEKCTSLEKKEQDATAEFERKVSDLENALQVSQKELQARVRKLDGDVKLQGGVIEQFEIEKTVAEKEKEDLNFQIGELSQKIVELERRELSRIQGDTVASALQGQLNELHGQLRETCRENRKLQEQYDNETDRSRELSLSIEKLQVDVTKVQQQAAHEAEEYKSKVSLLQSQLEATLSSTKMSDSSEKHDHEIFMLKAEVNKRDVLIDDLRKSITGLQENLGKAEKNLEEKNAQDEKKVEDGDATNSELQKISLFKASFCGERTLCLEEAIQQCEALLHEKEAFKHDVDDMVFKLLEKEAELAESKTRMEQLFSQVASLEEQAEFDRSEKEILFEEEKQHKSEIEKLQRALLNTEKAANSTKEYYDAEIRKLKTVLSSSDQASEIVRLKEDVATHEKSAKDAEILLQDSNQHLSEASSEVQRLTDTIIKQDADIKRLQADLESYIAMCEISSANKSTKHNLDRSLLNASDIKDGKVLDLEEKLDKLQQEQVIMEDQLKFLQEERAALMEDVSLRSAEMEAMTTEIQKYQSETITCKETYDNDIHRLNCELKSAKAELEEMHKQLESVETTQDVACQIDDTTVKDEIETLTSSVEKLKNLLRDEATKSIELQHALNDASASKTAESHSVVERDNLQPDEILHQLSAARKTNSDLLQENEELKEVIRQNRGKLLAENNKELDQQRLLHEADQAKKDSFEVFAQERDRANKEINALQQKLEEVQVAFAKAESEKDIAVHQLGKQSEDCCELKKQMNELQKILDGQRQAAIFSGKGQADCQALEKRIKQLSLNLDLTKQKLAKAEETKKELQDANRRFAAEQMEYQNISVCLEESKQKISTKDQQLSNLKDDISKKRTLLLEKQNEIDELKKLLTAAEQKMSEASEKWKSEASLLKEHLNNAQLALEAEKARCNNLSNDIQNLHEDIKKIKQDNHEEKAAFEESYQSQLKLQCEKVDKLQLLVDNGKIASSKKEATIENMSSELSKAKDLFAEKDEELSAQLQKYNELLEQYREKSNEVGSMQKTIREKEHELNDLIAQRDGIKTEISSEKKAEYEKVIVDLKSSLNSTKAELQEIKHCLDGKDAVLRDKEVALEHASAAMKSHEKQLNTDRVALNQYKDDYNKLLDQYEEKSTNVNRLESSLEEKESAMSDLLCKIQNLQTALTKYEDIEKDKLQNERNLRLIEGELQSPSKVDVTETLKATRELRDARSSPLKENDQNQLLDGKEDLSEVERNFMMLYREFTSLKEKYDKVISEQESNTTLIDKLSHVTQKVNELEDELATKEKLLQDVTCKKNEDSKILQVQLERISQDYDLLKKELEDKGKELVRATLEHDQVQPKLKEKLEHALSQVNNLSSTNVDLQNRLEEKREAQDTEKTLLKEADEKIALLESEATAFTQEVQILKDQLVNKDHDLKCVMHDKDHEVSELKASLEASASKIEEFTKRCHVLDEEMCTKTAELNHKHKLLQEAQNRIKELEKRLKTDLSDDSLQALSTRINELQEELDLLRLEYRRKDNGNVYLQKVLSERDEQLNALNKQFESTYEQLEKVQVKLEATLSEKDLLSVEKQHEMDCIVTEKAILEDRLKKKDSALENAVSETQQIKSVVSQLQVKLKDLENLLSDDKAEQWKLLLDQEHLSDAEKNFLTLYHEFTQLSNTHNDALKSLEEKQQKCANLSLQVQQLQSSVEVSNNEAQQVCDQYAELEKKLSDEVSEKNTMKENFQLQVNELKSKLQEVETSYNGFQAEVENFKTSSDSIELLKRQLETSEERNTSLNHQIADLQRTTDQNAKSESDSLYQQLREKNKTIIELEARTAELKAEVDQFETLLETAVQESKKEIEYQTEKRCQAYKEAYNKLTSSFQEKEKEAKDVAERLKNLSSETKNAAITIQNLQEECDKWKTLSEENETFDELKKRMKLQEKQLQNRSGRIQELELLCMEYDKEQREYEEKIKNLESKQKDLRDEDVRTLRQEFETRIATLEEEVKTKQEQLEAAQSSAQTSVFSGGFVQRTKLDIQEHEMNKLKHEMKFLEKELAKYKDIEVKRRAENQALLDKNNRMKNYLRKFRAAAIAQNREALAEKTENTPSGSSKAVPDEVGLEVHETVTIQSDVDVCKTQ